MNVRFLKITYAMMTVLLLAACTQDDEPSGNTLPEDKYPLEIASVTMSVEGSERPWSADVPQTRVSENPDRNSSTWDWDGTEKIGVRLYADGDVATYTLNTGKTLTPDKTLYWKNKEQTSVSAWYPTETEVSLANQKDKLAYVLTGSGTGDYNNPVTLGFAHALAKVRVVLKGSDEGKVTDVKIKSFTSCTHTEGESIQGKDEGWITMQYVTDKKCWEANVVPDHEIKSVKVTANGEIETPLSTTLTPQARKVNTITLTVGKGLTEIKGGETIDKPGDYIITGHHSETITLNAEGINLTLQDVNVSVSGKDVPAIDIKGGSTVITVEGTNNTLSSSQWGGITMSGSANLTIQGAGKEKSSLRVTAGNNDGLEASNVGIGAASNATCGDIKIENITLSVSGGDARKNPNSNLYELSCAAIGTSTANSKCGNIEIKESIITAKGGNGAAAIGLGYTGGVPGSPDTWHNRVESITISNSTVKATVKGTSWDEGGACIGLCTATGTAKLECGTITIKDVNETEFLNNLKREGNFDSTKSWKIGKGMIMSTNQGTVIFSGGTFNGRSFADGYEDW